MRPFDLHPQWAGAHEGPGGPSLRRVLPFRGDAERMGCPALWHASRLRKGWQVRRAGERAACATAPVWAGGSGVTGLASHSAALVVMA